jgi:hypothetical protein
VKGRYLLAAHAVIALVIAEGEHHGRVSAWTLSLDRIALCPITEGALIRYMLRVGETTETALRPLAALHASPRAEFWPDAISHSLPSSAERSRGPLTRSAVAPVCHEPACGWHLA